MRRRNNGRTRCSSLIRMSNIRHQSVAQIRALGVGFVAVIRRWVPANRLQDRVWVVVASSWCEFVYIERIHAHPESVWQITHPSPSKNPPLNFDQAIRLKAYPPIVVRDVVERTTALEGPDWRPRYRSDPRKGFRLLAPALTGNPGSQPNVLPAWFCRHRLVLPRQ
uniref:Uncharacterized protein n=1 Tax=uncultured gamma proteobacterium HF0010_16J05 TaxID=710981 RepID=E0XR67_9GAMM|nr:hypothetical protein [uncultured gamma proteobacterium HF0010_16J05]